MLQRSMGRILQCSKTTYNLNPRTGFTVNHCSQKERNNIKYENQKYIRKNLPLLNANFMKYINRNLSTSPQSLTETDEEVKITYIDRDEEIHVIKGKVGDNVMYLAHEHDLDIEGACEASLACCTCHVYVENDFYEKLPEPEEEEEDMLDLAPFLQENSRLSCQIILDKNMDGIVVRLPTATRNFYVDGHKPHHH